MKHRYKERGFTLVELNLAMVSVAVLVIAVALVTINVTKINQHGVLLKSINQTGREVMDMLERDFAAARTDKVEYVAPTASTGVGRLCLGTVSYVFNTAQALNGIGGPTIQDVTVTPSRTITLVRMDDKDGTWCQQPGGVFTKSAVSAGDRAVELLQADTVPVAVHELAVRPLATSSDTQQSLQELRLLIGTNELNTVDAGTCRPPTDHQSNFDECVVREFRTIIRSNGMTKESP